MTDEGLITEEYDLEAIISENKNLKKKIGDQGNELGSLRRGMDQILQNQSAQQNEVDEWADPVEQEVSGLKQELNDFKTEAALRDLESKHPGYRDLPNDESFQGWVQGSDYRSNLYRKADSMDLTAADELFTAWEESQETANQNHQAATTTRSKALNDASMEKGTAGGVKKSYFSRTALIDMRINNPSKYEAMRDEIMKAYAEGRVKK